MIVWNQVLRGERIPSLSNGAVRFCQSQLHNAADKHRLFTFSRSLDYSILITEVLAEIENDYRIL